MKPSALLILALAFLSSHLASAQLEFAIWTGGGVALVDYQALDNDLTAYGYPKTNEGMYSALLSIQLKKAGSRWAGNFSYGSSSQSDRIHSIDPTETESRLSINNQEFAYGADYFILNKKGVKFFPGLSLVSNQTTITLHSGLPIEDSFNSLLNADIRSDKFVNTRASLKARMNVEFDIKLKGNYLTLGLNGAYQFGRRPSYWRYESENGPSFFFRKKLGESYYVHLTIGYRWNGNKADQS